MIKFYFAVSRKIFPLIALLALGLSGFSSYAGTGELSDTIHIKPTKTPGKLSDTRKNKPAFLNTGVKVNFTPYKPADIKPAPAPAAAKQAQPADSKLLTNVKVYPNPVEDQINVAYHMNKTSTVTIKLTDVLGTEIAVLLSQKVEAGERLFTYNMSAKLNSGIYFIHIIAGNEPVIKRISVL
jgi:hypothetical protein